MTNAARTVELHRRWFRLWDLRVSSLLDVGRRVAPNASARDALEFLRHKRDRVGVKVERLARASDRALAARELDTAWRELEEAWDVALIRIRPTAAPPASPAQPRLVGVETNGR